MKKRFLLTAVFAVSICLSCTKTPAPKEQVSVSFCAESTDTKTVFGTKDDNSTYPVLWSEGDKVGIGLNDSDADWSTVTITRLEEGRSAAFRTTFDKADSYHFMFMSPSSQIKELHHEDETFYAEIPSIQTPAASGPDPLAQILYATAEYSTLPSAPISLEFKHFTAYLHITIKNLDIETGQTLQSVVITGGDDCYLTGRNTLDVESGSFTPIVSRALHNVTVNTLPLTGTVQSFDIWCGVRAGDFKGKELTFEINTDQKFLTKTITLGTEVEELQLQPGGVAAFSVNMSGKQWQTPEQYTLVPDVSDLHVGDEIIIAAASSATDDNNYALGTTQNGNNRSMTGINRIGDNILNPSSSVEIFQLEDGAYPGTFALKATRRSGYVYAAGTSSSQNYLRTKNSLDLTGSWQIYSGPITNNNTTDKNWPDKEKLAAIKAYEAGNSSIYIRCYVANSSFSCYGANTGMLPVQVYRGEAGPENHFNVTDSQCKPLSDMTVSYAAHTIPIYIFGNVAWTASVTGGGSLDVNAGTGPAELTLSIPANPNPETPRDISVNVQTTADVDTQSFSFTVSQQGPVYAFILSKSNHNYGSNGSYAGESDVEIDGVTWHVKGVTNSTTYDGWRIGGNSSTTFTNEDRVIYSKTAIPEKVTKVAVKNNAIGKITVNSFTLTVHASANDAANGTNPISTISGTFSTTDWTQFVKPNDNTSWEGRFYRIKYNLTKTDTTGNGYVQFGGIKMYDYPVNN